MDDPDRIDWLARKAGGVIDFRLEGDPPTIPVEVLRARRRAYLDQQRIRMGAGKRGAMAGRATDRRGLRFDPRRWADYFDTE